jgi:hypothetical protein
MSDPDLSAMASEAEAIVNRIKPHLAGVETQIIGAVLGDLVAMFIAGHRAEDPGGKAADTKAIQELVLQMHIDLVRSLIPINMAAIDAQPDLPRRPL